IARPTSYQGSDCYGGYPTRPSPQRHRPSFGSAVAASAAACRVNVRAAVRAVTLAGVRAGLC
ncbi:MAG TPA: hypothetical protein VFP34_15165, partial [Microlunatus sp.]|nr:hypothetical protein [Microlunatus sp.]